MHLRHHTTEVEDKEEKKEVSDKKEEPVHQLEKRFAPYGPWGYYPFYQPHPYAAPSYAPAKAPAPAAYPSWGSKKMAPVVKVPIIKAPGKVVGSQTQTTFGADGKARNQQTNTMLGSNGVSQGQSGKMVGDDLTIGNANKGWRALGFPGYPSPSAYAPWSHPAYSYFPWGYPAKAPLAPAPAAYPPFAKALVVKVPFVPGPFGAFGQQVQTSFGADGKPRNQHAQNFKGNAGAQVQSGFLAADGQLNVNQNQNIQRSLVRLDGTNISIDIPKIFGLVVKLLPIIKALIPITKNLLPIIGPILENVLDLKEDLLEVIGFELKQVIKIFSLSFRPITLK